MIAMLLLQVVARTYWPATVPQIASGTFRHTHVAVTGIVAYTRIEDDGDLHIRLVADTGTVFIIAECLATLPCRRPHNGERVTVRGISRRDPEHGWYEVHPVEELTP